jgi:hypothetical protein
MYSSGLKFVAALIWNQNPIFEMPLGSLWVKKLPVTAR